MGRIQRVNELESEQQEVAPSEIRIVLDDGTVAKFRPVVLEDIRTLTAAGIKNEIEAAGRLIVRACTQWGDKPGITLPQLRQVDMDDINLITETLSPETKTSIVDLPDKTKSVTLNDGTEVIFRRLNYGDVEAIARYRDNDLEAQVVLATRLCIKWGDADKITEPQLNKLNMGDWQAIALALSSFRPNKSQD